MSGWEVFLNVSIIGIPALLLIATVIETVLDWRGR